MPRPRNLTPSYLPHASGQGRLVWTDTLGVRHYRMLPGPFGSPESLAAKARLELEIATAPTRALSETAAPIAVNEVLLAHRDYADRHYRRADGSRTHEVVEYRTVCRVVRELYGLTPAAEFGPLALKAVRRAMIARGWCRTLVNQRIGRARRVFKWAVAEQLIPAAVHLALAAVGGLQRGRSKVRDAPPVGPVDEAVVDATLPHLNRHVRGLVGFQRWTGCRPGEACTVRRADIDTGGAVWLYRPAQHKNTWRGKDRVPRAWDHEPEPEILEPLPAGLGHTSAPNRSFTNAATFGLLPNPPSGGAAWSAVRSSACCVGVSLGSAPLSGRPSVRAPGPRSLYRLRIARPQARVNPTNFAASVAERGRRVE